MLPVDEALGANATSKVFHTSTATELWIRFAGDFDGQTVTVQSSVQDQDFSDFVVDKTVQEFTAPTMAKYPLPGGLRFRCTVSDGGSPSIDIHVAGHGVHVAN